MKDLCNKMHKNWGLGLGFLAGLILAILIFAGMIQLGVYNNKYVSAFGVIAFATLIGGIIDRKLR